MPRRRRFSRSRRPPARLPACPTGSTGPAGLPVATGSPRGGGDTFVTKLNPGGTAALYTTYIGGSDSDDSSDIAVDAARNVSRVPARKAGP